MSDGEARRPGPTVLITGATSGIGAATAIELARRGARVIVHGRTRESAEAARAEVLRAAPGATASAVSADLSSLAQVRDLAAALLSEPRLDVVLHNAGAERWERSLTADGLEATFVVNHLAPYLLTRLLEPLLERSAPARVVWVSSLVHAWGEIHWDDLSAASWYSAEPVYYQSKLAAALAAGAIARRLAPRGVDVFLAPPGLTRTRFARDLRGAARLWSASVGRVAFRDPRDVARELGSVALDARFTGLGFAYVDRLAVRLPAPRARVEADIGRMDQVSAALVGLPALPLAPPLARPPLSRPRPGSWVPLVAGGELLGFSLTGLIALLALATFGRPHDVAGRVVALVTMTFAGVIEGASLGGSTWLALRGWLPDLPARAFVGPTVAVAAGGWLCGMSVPLLHTVMAAPTAAAPAAEPGAAATLLFAALFGALAGLMFGAVQRRALARHTARTWPWVLGQTLGWGLGLPIAYLAGASSPAEIGWLGVAALMVLAGLGMGLAVAVCSYAATRAM